MRDDFDGAKVQFYKFVSIPLLRCAFRLPLCIWTGILKFDAAMIILNWLFKLRTYFGHCGFSDPWPSNPPRRGSPGGDGDEALSSTIDTMLLDLPCFGDNGEISSISTWNTLPVWEVKTSGLKCCCSHSCSMIKLQDFAESNKKEVNWRWGAETRKEKSSLSFWILKMMNAWLSITMVTSLNREVTTGSWADRSRLTQLFISPWKAK